jgi:hypothetical protein
MTDLIKNNTQLEKENNNISKALLSELVTPSLDLSIDYSEIFIDDLIDNPALKEIPIVKSVVGVIKGGISINQFWFAKKLLVFINKFNDGTLKPEKLIEFKNKIENEKNFGKKVAERLMVFIDRNIEIQQTQIIANLFKAYVSGDIDYNQFVNITITLDKLNPKAYAAFFDLEKYDFYISSSNHKDFGARNFEMETYINNSGFATEPSSWFSGLKLTDDGLNLFEYGIKPLRKNNS